MNKNRRFMKFSIFCITCTFLFTVVVSATSYTFTDSKVPRSQGYKTLLAVKKSLSSNDGFVELDKLTPDAVTFSARATNASYGSATVVYQTGLRYTVNYTNVYGPGQEMQARYRNHNWSLNEGLISGTFEYK